MIKIILLILIFMLSPIAVYGNINEITGHAYLLKERSTGRIIVSHNIDDIIYPASTIKILTALIALDYIAEDDIITVGNEIYYMPAGSSHAGHFLGEQISGINLIRGLLLRSGNDTSNIAVAHVARIITGETLPFTEAETLFTNLMNDRSYELGATSSNFTNAHGFFHPEMVVTARDLAIISDYAINNPIIRKIVSETHFEGYGATGSNIVTTREISWASTNRLLAGEFYYPYAIGFKTGFHDQAGHCFIGVASKDGIELISVIMGSNNLDRWRDTATLFEYGFNNYAIRDIQLASTAIGQIEIENPRWGTSSHVDFFGIDNFRYYLSQNEFDNLIRTVSFNEGIYTLEDGVRLFKAPMAAGDRIGNIRYTLNGIEIFNNPILIQDNVFPWSVLSSFVYVVGVVSEDPFSITSIAFFFGLFFVLAILFWIIKFFVVFSMKKSKDPFKRKKSRNRGYGQ